MLDLNILNKAVFEDQTPNFDVLVLAGKTEKVSYPLAAGQVFCLQEISWKYSVANEAGDNYGWPKKPLSVSLNEVFKDRTEVPFRCSPIKLLNQLSFSIVNPSSVAVRVHFYLKGTLVTSKNSSDPLSYKEIFGYLLLNDNQKGLLALTEVLADKNNLSLDTILSSVVTGALPDSTPHKAMAVQTPKALPAPTENLISLMIGDLVTFPSWPDAQRLELKTLQELAKYLVEKQWSR